MQFFKFIAVFLLCQGAVLAQYQHVPPDVNKTIGTLENILFNALDRGLSDRDKIVLCDSLARLYSLNEEYDKSIEHAIRALKLAEENDFTDYRKRLLQLIGTSYFWLDKYETSIGYYTKLLDIHIQEDETTGTINTYIEIGRSYFQWSKYKEAREFSEKALKLAEEQKYNKGIALAQKQLGSIMTVWGEYDEALRYYQFPLKYWEESGDKIGLARMYNSMGMLHEELTELDKAEEYYSRAMDLFDRVGDTWDFVNMTLHLGDIYLKGGNYKKALEAYFVAEKKGIELNNKKLNAITLSNIGEAYNLMGNFSRALEYQQKSLELKKEIGDKKRLAITYNELGKIYTNLGQYDNALANLYKSLDAGTESNLKSQLKVTYRLLSDVCDSIGNFKESLQYFRIYNDLKDSLFSAESNRMVTEMRTKYESEKKEKENERLRSAELVSKNKIRNQKWLIALIIVSLFFALLQVYVFYSKNKSIKKINDVLSIQNQQIESQKKVLQELNGKLTEANATKDKFFSIVAHDLKNPFTSLLGFSDLLVTEYDSIDEADKMKYLEQLKQSAQSTYSLLSNLLEWARTQTGQVTLHPESLQLADVSKEACNLSESSALRKKIKIDLDIPHNLKLYADRNMLLAVLHNLISNAIKFTHEGGNVRIIASATAKEITIEVNDNGVGIPEDTLGRLFHIGTKVQSPGTANEQGTGLGLILCREFVEKNGGTIHAESTPGKGSSFIINFPAPA